MRKIRIFCICAPFLGQLAKIWPPFPMVIIGVPILIMALVVLKLPETSNRILPQTVQNVQDEPTNLSEELGILDSRAHNVSPAGEPGDTVF